MRYFVILVFGIFIHLLSYAQYVWMDAAGQKVFSDLPPPIDIPIKRVLKQPEKLSIPNTDANKRTNTDQVTEESKINNRLNINTNATSENSKKDKDLEAAKKNTEEAAATKKKIELEVSQKMKADNCNRAKNAKTTLDSGMRLSHTNPKGEQGFMDDATRLVETKRLEGIIALDCK